MLFPSKLFQIMIFSQNLTKHVYLITVDNYLKMICYKVISLLAKLYLISLYQGI